MLRAKDAFNSRYVIDGMQMDSTPAQLLQECNNANMAEDPEGSISDESLDPEPGKVIYDSSLALDYLKSLNHGKREFQMDWPENFSRQRVAFGLIDAIWQEGHFRLDDLSLSLSWRWNSAALGNMAAFYYSAGAVADYIYDLGVALKDCSFKDYGEVCRLECGVRAEKRFSEEDEPVWMGLKRLCPEKAVADKASWLVYIPFDSCPFRLGGSLLEEALGSNGDVAPEVQDPDYFIDSYEVVRELAEDKIAIAGITVGDGGLLAAADNFCAQTGCSIDISGISSSYQEADRARILFGEVPGVIIQVRDIDLDYLDVQLTLQDIAYYPLGHPDTSAKGVSISGKRGAIGTILASLLSQASEGED